MMAEVDFPNNICKISNKDYEEKSLVFKNYVPINQAFKIAKLPYFDTVNEIEDRFAKKVRKAVKEFINLEKNPLNIVPKKNNIDLKKFLSSKLDRLNKRTEISILELISNNTIYSKEDNLKLQKQELKFKEEKDITKENNEANNEENGKADQESGTKLIKAMEMQMNIEV